MKNRLFTILFGILFALFIVSFGIAFPILFRPFYYWQINSSIIPIGEASVYWKPEWDYSTIKQAYNEVLDFCCFPWDKEFSAGVFKFSSDGASHFADCKGLFMLDFIVLGLTFFGVGTLHILKRKKIIEFTKLFNRSVYFWSGVTIVSVFLIILVAILIAGFDKAFETFHAIFFPGKGNWIFYYDVDEIINVMPEEFFLSCAICIGSLIFAGCGISIASDFIKFKKKENKA